MYMFLFMSRPMEMSSKRPLAVGQQEMQSKKHVCRYSFLTY